jgi:hypothetical protein
MRDGTHFASDHLIESDKSGNKKRKIYRKGKAKSVINAGLNLKNCSMSRERKKCL